MTTRPAIAFCGLFIFWTVAASAIEPATAGHPRELGRVDWSRDFKTAEQTARTANKPRLLLFQEVPGCGTCVNYGDLVLSHPLLVEAMETLFVPVAVYNNRGDPDEAVRKTFQEPAWNNPVVRIVSADGTELAPRLSDDYSVAGLASRMITSLERTKRGVPEYLRMVAEESLARRHGLDRAVLAMSCFWSGEADLGALPGVMESRPGFLDGHEVVELAYDPAKLSLVDLIQGAAAAGCARRVYVRTPEQRDAAQDIVGATFQLSTDPIRPDGQPKFYLAQTPLKYVPMTERQAVRVNAAVGHQQDPSGWLSPRQIKLWRMIEQHPEAGWSKAVGRPDFAAAWDEAGRKAANLEPGGPR